MFLAFWSVAHLHFRKLTALTAGAWNENFGKLSTIHFPVFSVSCVYFFQEMVGKGTLPGTSWKILGPPAPGEMTKVNLSQSFDSSLPNLGVLERTWNFSHQMVGVSMERATASVFWDSNNWTGSMLGNFSAEMEPCLRPENLTKTLLDLGIFRVVSMSMSHTQLLHVHASMIFPK